MAGPHHKNSFDAFSVSSTTSQALLTGEKKFSTPYQETLASDFSSKEENKSDWVFKSSAPKPKLKSKSKKKPVVGKLWSTKPFAALGACSKIDYQIKSHKLSILEK